MTPAQMERMALWAIVLILIVFVVFVQRRSGFTPAAGAPISLMDLQEYSGFSEKQKMDYRTELSRKQTELSAVTDYTDYSNKLNEIMRVLFTMPVPPQGPVM
jgi:hypothetical protein